MPNLIFKPFNAFETCRNFAIMSEFTSESSSESCYASNLYPGFQGADDYNTYTTLVNSAANDYYWKTKNNKSYLDSLYTGKATATSIENISSDGKGSDDYQSYGILKITKEVSAAKTGALYSVYFKATENAYITGFLFDKYLHVDSMVDIRAWMFGVFFEDGPVYFQNGDTMVFSFVISYYKNKPDTGVSNNYPLKKYSGVRSVEYFINCTYPSLENNHNNNVIPFKNAFGIDQHNLLCSYYDSNSKNYSDSNKKFIDFDYIEATDSDYDPEDYRSKSGYEANITYKYDATSASVGFNFEFTATGGDKIVKGFKFFKNLYYYTGTSIVSVKVLMFAVYLDDPITLQDGYTISGQGYIQTDGTAVLTI